MARIKPSAKIDQVRGKVGDLIFAGVRGASVVKRHIQGADRKSDSQLLVRSAFTLVKNSWLSLSAEIINSWTRFAGDLRGTGYNLFLAANLAQERTDDWRILTPLNYKVKPLGSVESEAGPAEGDVTISWEAGSANPAHQVWAFVREVGTAAVVHEAGWTADVSAGEVVVDGLTEGKEYRIYLSVYDATQAAGDRFSESRECLGEAEGVPTVWFSDGFEDGFNPWTGVQITGEENDIAVSSIRAKVGTHSAMVLVNEAEVADKAYCYKGPFGSVGAGNHLWASAWLWFSTGFNCEAGFNFIQMHENTGAYKGFIVQMLDNEVLKINDGINSASYDQESPIAVPTNRWVPLELHIWVDNSDGIVELWQDKVMVIQQTGIDTLPATNYARFAIGLLYLWGGIWSGPDTFYIDEVCIQNQQKIR